MTYKDNSELEWLAFRYVAAEMSAEEGEAFERRLADDQAARAAVATMVELTQTLVAAEAVMCGSSVATATRHAPTWWYPVAWMSLGALACALLLVLFSPAFLRPASGPGRGGNSPLRMRSTATPELASAWWQARQEMAAGNDLGDWADSNALEPVTAELESRDEPSADEEVVSSEDLPIADDGLKLLPPDWMMTAVEHLSIETHPQPTAE